MAASPSVRLNKAYPHSAKSSGASGRRARKILAGLPLAPLLFYKVREVDIDAAFFPANFFRSASCMGRI
jgi:hypothetical protein